uniref:Erlin-1 n=1 Tax=Hirondellea gigas TaxID=1518452 RepID=A0A2P2IA52_9CRUS
MASPVLLAGVAGVLMMLLCVPLGLHKVQEGCVGVYWIGGALLSSTTYPGYHTMIPFITKHRSVQISVQTDVVRDIPCGTSGGVLIEFEKVEVVNRLNPGSVIGLVKNYTVDYDRLWIYDKVHHEINQLCSTHTLQEIYIEIFEQIDELLLERLQREWNIWAPGLELIAIRVTKPRIPKLIGKHFDAMEAEVAQLTSVSAEQQIVLQEAETTRRKAVIEAQKILEVAKINCQRNIDEQKSKLQVSAIENEMLVARAVSNADAVFYAAKQEAEANKELLTTDFLELERVRSLSKNAKFIVGSQIPNSLFVGDSAGKIGKLLK